MGKTTWLAFILFAAALCIGIRVEWLNAQSGYSLPAWRNRGEEGFSRSYKLRSSPYALDRFWENSKGSDYIESLRKDRPRLQKEAATWNGLLRFGYWALLQFPILFVLNLLLLRLRFRPLKFKANLIWWAGALSVVALWWSAFFRDYTYRLYGL